MTLRLPLALVVAVALPGCDQLFPELVGPAPDLSTMDGPGPGSLTGQVCVLADLRNPTSCSVNGGGRRVTIEETRVSADVDATGHFSISLAGVTGQATVAVVDGVSTTGQTTPTVTLLSPTTLAATRGGSGVLLPCVPRSAMTTLIFQAGGFDDPSRGALVGWLIDSAGVPVKNASAAPMLSAIGPLYDGATPSELDSGVATGAHGTLAFLQLPPGDAKIVVVTPAAAAVAGDSFTLPIRGGGVTVAALPLPSR
jgi:hypothetical protein